MKILKWMIKSLIFGLVAIIVFNLIGVYLDLNIPLNIYTIIIVGCLRIPGLAALIILMNFF